MTCYALLPIIFLVIVQIQGQTADLSDLQRILNRSKTKLSDQQQQNLTARPPNLEAAEKLVLRLALFVWVTSMKQSAFSMLMY